MEKVLLATLLIFSIPVLGFSNGIGEIIWTDSFLDPIDHVPLDRLKFGYITVPEDYKRPDGRLLKIAFVVIKSKSGQSNNDASIDFKGGWGSQTITNLPYYLNNFLGNNRDLILYDYRGTGYSEPTFCPELGPRVLDNFLADRSYADFKTWQSQIFNDCLDELEEKGIDYNQYGTENKARDGVLLAKALGYDSYNLFGVSYGTKTILQFIRHADVKIRSVILDSNCPLDFPINSGMTEDYANSLNSILEDCENDSNCNRKYPQLKEDLNAFLNSLDKKPLKVKIGGKAAYLNRQEVNGVIHQLLYDEWNYGVVPYLLTKFIKRNKLVLNKTLQGIEEAVLDNYNGVGLINYVYDHKPFQDTAALIAEKSIKTYPTFQVFDGYQHFFLADDRFQSNPEMTEAISVEIPTLIMAGGYDPITPAYYSERIRKHFNNHYYIELPRTGHAVTNNWCGRSLAKSFLNSLKDPTQEEKCYGDVKGRKIHFER